MERRSSSKARTRTGSGMIDEPEAIYGVDAPLPLPEDTVYDIKLCEVMEKAGLAFAVIDWCTTKYRGAAEFFYISGPYCELHGWGSTPNATSSAQLAEDITDSFRGFLLGVKKKVQFKQIVDVSRRKLRMGDFKFTNVPFPFQPPAAGASPLVATLTLVESMAQSEEHLGENILRLGLCCSYSMDLITLASLDGKVLARNDKAKQWFEAWEAELATESKELSGGSGKRSKRLVVRQSTCPAQTLYNENATFLQRLVGDVAYAEVYQRVVEDHGSFEQRVQVAAGEWHLLRAQACFDPCNEGKWAVAVTQTDVSEQVRLEEVENKRKDMLFANVSHELKTPLNGIIALTDVLLTELEGSVNDDVVGNLRVIHDSGNRLNNLVSNLLDASLIKEKKLNIRMEDDVDLKSLAESVVKLSAPLLKSSDVVLVNRVGGGFPHFRGDKERLTQIVQNLVGNAAKFTFVGSIGIEADTKVLRNKQNLRLGQEIRIHVRDTGIGIPKDKQKIIFEALRQVDEGADRKFGGTGLGLTISLGLARGMGGSIGVTSQPGVGSCFTVRLPVYDEGVGVHHDSAGGANGVAHGGVGVSSLHVGVGPLHSPGSSHGIDSQFDGATSTPTSQSGNEDSRRSSFEDIHRRSSSSRFRGQMPSCSDMTGQVEVLSVDDELSNQSVVKALLKKRDFRITLASDGVEAIELLEQRASAQSFMPDIILLDVMMPRMNGFECCSKVRDMFPLCAIPIIMVSAKSREENVIQGLSCGSNDYVTKPFKKLELLARIDTQLRLRNAWRTEPVYELRGRRPL